MDCQTFDATLIDALYDELDPVTSAAFDEHAAGCERCATRAARLKKTHALVRSNIDDVPFPAGLEDRILAAATSAMQSAPAGPTATAPAGGAKIYAFFSRPQLAVAAAFVLVFGSAVAILGTTSRSAPMASAPAAPGAAARELASAASDLAPPPATAPLQAPAPAATIAAATAAAEPLALADDTSLTGKGSAAKSPAKPTAGGAAGPGALALAPAAPPAPRPADYGDPWSERPATRRAKDTGPSDAGRPDARAAEPPKAAPLATPPLPQVERSF